MSQLDSLKVIRASLDDCPILRNLMQLYLYDMSVFENSDVGAQGLFPYRHLDHYWTEEGRHPFLLLIGDNLAGFVLVNKHRIISPTPDTHTVAEFFVLRKHRRLGIGRRAAIEVFEMFPGPWEVQQQDANVVAQQFWRSVISQYTNGRYDEVDLHDERWRGPIQTFHTGDSSQRYPTAM